MGMLATIKFRLISRNVKIKIFVHKTTSAPVIVCGCRTLVSQTQSNSLNENFWNPGVEGDIQI
jgi:hypothetical protein